MLSAPDGTSCCPGPPRASTALKKRLWQQITQAKILAQAATLTAVGAEAGGFRLLARKVRSGDPDNVEAEAARRYWTLLFGAGFRRDHDGDENCVISKPRSSNFSRKLVADLRSFLVPTGRSKSTNSHMMR